MKNMTNAPPGINNEKEKILWQKIAGFKLDNPTAALPFSRKLALEHKWTYDFTLAAIEEYRKFIFLCCISPHGASPSKVIDEVWHLHLLYTENYWEEFCEKTLQRKLHHRPGGGGTEQKQKHHFWHLDTLEQYRNIFHQDPAPQYWLNVSETKANAQNGFKATLRKALSFTLFILFLLVSGCNGGAAPALILFSAIMVIGGISTALKNSEGPESKRKDQDGSGGGCSSGGSCGSSCGGGGCGGCGGCGS